MATIQKEIVIQAPAAQVWKFVGTEAGLRQWWQKEVSLEAKQGGRCSERGELNGESYQLEGIVAVYDPPRELVLTLAGAQPGAAWPTAMKISITLEEAEGVTTVRVVHGVIVALPSALPQPQPMQPQPLWRPATIVNRWPGQPQTTQPPSKPVAPTENSASVTHLLHELYANWWTGRLNELQRLAGL